MEPQTLERSNTNPPSPSARTWLMRPATSGYMATASTDTLLRLLARCSLHSQPCRQEDHGHSQHRPLVHRGWMSVASPGPPQAPIPSSGQRQRLLLLQPYMLSATCKQMPSTRSWSMVQHLHTWPVQAAPTEYVRLTAQAKSTSPIPAGILPL